MDTNKLYEFYNKVDRSIFLDNEYAIYAKVNSALPIGFGQTISQPSLVFEMTKLLDLNKTCKVLEIGTGSGYQTLFLAHFAKKVYTVELIDELSKKAKNRMTLLGYKNIKYKVGDGTLGWKKNAPYDRIIVTAAANKMPKNLVEQLKNNGKMVIPIGPKYNQDLVLLTKDGKGNITTNNIEKVTFVELKGSYGWESD